MGTQRSTIAVITSRWQSTRFPGKALALYKGKPLLQILYDTASKVCQTVVATTVNSSPIIDYCFQHDITCVICEDEDDLLGRLKIAAIQPTVVRLWGDAPFIEARQIEKAIELYYEYRSPYFTLKNKATGECVAVTSAELIMKLNEEVTDPKDREWIHKFMSNLHGAITYQEEGEGCPRLIDTPEDLQKLNGMF